MTPGEIRWVELPLTKSHTQAGRRPAIIVQNDAYAGSSPMVVVVPLTTSLGPMRYPGSMLIAPTIDNGLTCPSVALCFQIRAIDRDWVRDRIGVLMPAELHDLYNLLDRVMGRS